MWIVRLALRRPYTFVVAALLVMILGVVTIFRTPTDIFPNVDIPVIAVVFQYGGMSADDVETRIVTQFERFMVTTVNDIDHVESQSLNGVGVMKVFFQRTAKIEDPQTFHLLKTIGGIIQPLIVRKVDGRHELIAGERRWRAALAAGLAEVPVIIRTADDRDVLELSLIENLQRADLNPIEEAQGYARLAGEFGMRQEEIAQKVGRSRAAVANAMRLLDLPEQVQTWVTQNLISVGHAKVLLALKSSEEQLAIAETVLRRSATPAPSPRAGRPPVIALSLVGRACEAAKEH